MSKYTTTFLEIARVLKGDFVEFAEAVELVKPFLFKRVMPFYNDNAEDKSIFQIQFIGHYMNYELGFETPDMFIGRLYNRLAIIMPRYTQLYKTMQLDLDDMLRTFSEEETREGTENGNNNFTNTLTHGLKTVTTSTDSGEATQTNNLTNAENRNLTKIEDRNLGNSRIETINQQTLNSDEPNTTILSNAYASNLQKVDADNQWTGTDTGTVETTDSGTVSTSNTGTVKNISSANGNVNQTNSGDDKTVNSGGHNINRNETVTRKGYNADKNRLLAEFRDNILNLNAMLISECADLFMQIF